MEAEWRHPLILNKPDKYSGWVGRRFVQRFTFYRHGVRYNATFIATACDTTALNPELIAYRQIPLPGDVIILKTIIQLAIHISFFG